MLDINTVYEVEAYPENVQRIGCEVIEEPDGKQYAKLTVEQLEDLLRMIDEHGEMKRVASYQDLPTVNGEIMDTTWDEFGERIDILLNGN